MNSAPATKPESGHACYIYGIVPKTMPEPHDARGVGSPPSPVQLLRHQRVGALVSEIETDAPLGTPDDLRAHARILDAVAAARTPVLPLRFGSVVRDTDAVANDLLGPLEERLAAALEEFNDLAQFTLRGVYRQDRMLKEILLARPELVQLREEIAQRSADAGYSQRIRLGETISQEIAARREADSEVLLDRLTPLAVAVSRLSPSSAEAAVDVSLLVHGSKRAALEAAAEDLAREWAGRIDLRLLGPLAPYDFMSDIAEEIFEQAESAL